MPRFELVEREGPQFQKIANAHALLVQAVNHLRIHQQADGSADASRSARDAAQSVLDTGVFALSLAGQRPLARAFEADMADWMARGLQTLPAFDATRDVYVPPKPGEWSLFVAPTLTPNGPAPRGYFMETFWAYREEPEICQALALRFPHPGNRCQSMRLLGASSGFLMGNCLVFSPENIRCQQKVQGQGYALFFFNKFHGIYGKITMPRVREIFGPADAWRSRGTGPWSSSGMSPKDCYDARCMWGYLHDYFHHMGNRPLDRNLQLTLDWHAGLVEEIKVDSLTALALLEGGMPHGAQIFQFIVFERLLRYPMQPDRLSSFDAGTGVFLFNWLRRHDALQISADGTMSLPLSPLRSALRELVTTVIGLERIQDDTDYLAAATRLAQAYLPPPHGPKDRFSMPLAYPEAAHPPAGDLSFRSMSY